MQVLNIMGQEEPGPDLVPFPAADPQYDSWKRSLPLESITYPPEGNIDNVVYQDAAKNVPVHQPDESSHKKRRLTEVQVQRRIRGANLEPQSVNILDSELINTVVGPQVVKQGILGEGPSAQLRWEQGILGGGPAAQFKEQLREELREQGILGEGPTRHFLGGPAPHPRNHGILGGRWPARHLRDQPRLGGWPAPHLTDQMISGGGGPALLLMDQGIPGGGPAPHLRDQGISGGVSALQLREQMMLGGGPPPQLRDALLPGSGLASQSREQGLLGRGPASAASESERLLMVNSWTDGRSVPWEHYNGDVAAVNGLLGRVPLPGPSSLELVMNQSRRNEWWTSQATVRM